MALLRPFNKCVLGILSHFGCFQNFTSLGRCHPVQLAFFNRIVFLKDELFKREFSISYFQLKIKMCQSYPGFSAAQHLSHVCSFLTKIFFLPNVKFKIPNPPLKSISNFEQVTLHGVCWRRGACVCFDKGMAVPQVLFLHSLNVSLENSANRQTVSPGEKNPVALSVFATLCFCHRYTCKSQAAEGGRLGSRNPRGSSQPQRHDVFSPNSLQSALCLTLLHQKIKRSLWSGRLGES